jgi:hypothetical protein
VTKKTTRKTVSMCREDYDALVAFAKEHDAPAARVVARGIKAVISGEIPLGDVPGESDLRERTREIRGTRTGPRGLSRDELEARIRQRDEEREVRDRADAIAKARAAARANEGKDRLDRLTERLPTMRAQPSEPTPCCAICTAEITGTPRREPMGRGGAMVAVCTPCATEPPSSGRYSFSGESSRGMTDGNVWISGSSRRSALGSR